jgi:hypothetical protein
MLRNQFCRLRADETPLRSPSRSGERFNSFVRAAVPFDASLERPLQLIGNKVPRRIFIGLVAGQATQVLTSVWTPPHGSTLSHR